MAGAEAHAVDCLNEYSTPAASGNAMTLQPTAHHKFWCILRSVVRESSMAPATAATLPN